MRIFIFLSLIINLAYANAAQKTEPFKRVFVEGNVNVNLHTGYKHPEILVEGDQRDLNTLEKKNKGQDVFYTLHGKPKYGPVNITVKADSLKHFSYLGRGTIRGDKLNTRNLNLSINNRGSTFLAGNIGLANLRLSGLGYTTIQGVSSYYMKVHLAGNPRLVLRGMANLTNVDISGKGHLDLYWVKSPYLVVNARGNSCIQLAGIAERMEVELWDSAQFKGRFLRAKEAFVRTHNRSTAEITALSKQHTLALDGSDILFYKLSTFSSNFMGNDGAVLDMMVVDG